MSNRKAVLLVVAIIVIAILLAGCGDNSNSVASKRNHLIKVVKGDYTDLDMKHDCTFTYCDVRMKNGHIFGFNNIADSSSPVVIVQVVKKPAYNEDTTICVQGYKKGISPVTGRSSNTILVPCARTITNTDTHAEQYLVRYAQCQFVHSTKGLKVGRFLDQQGTTKEAYDAPNPDLRESVYYADHYTAQDYSMAYIDWSAYQCPEVDLRDGSFDEHEPGISKPQRAIFDEQVINAEDAPIAIEKLNQCVKSEDKWLIPC